MPGSGHHIFIGKGLGEDSVLVGGNCYNHVCDFFNQMILIKRQVYTIGHGISSVDILKVDEFTGLARKIDNTKTEKEHLIELLLRPINNGTNKQSIYEILTVGKYYSFWTENP